MSQISVGERNDVIIPPSDSPYLNDSERNKKKKASNKSNSISEFIDNC
jgi:hypothetical protein